MSVKRLAAIGFIMGCTTAAWCILGSTLAVRTQTADERLMREVTGNWGAPMLQKQPVFFYIPPTGAQSRRAIEPLQSRITVDLKYDPKRKGLLWYRTYGADFEARYVIRNPTPIRQTIYAQFEFPVAGQRYDRFVFELGRERTDRHPEQGRLVESVILGPGEEMPVRVAYWAAGMNRWGYALGESPRVRNFSLRMKTDFAEIDVPAGAESPTSRQRGDTGWDLVWNYTDVLGAQSVGMEMPAVVNPGPVAARISFFAPVSLLFFFAVLVITGMVRGVNLHPMNYFFLAAGCFAFQLVFAYLVDLIPTMTAFVIAAAVSLIVVTGYLWRAVGGPFARISGAAQLAYMVLFSYSFFFRGLTGISITAGAVVTLALLMMFTARVNWSTVFGGVAPATVPPAIPATE